MKEGVQAALAHIHQLHHCPSVLFKSVYPDSGGGMDFKVLLEANGVDIFILVHRDNKKFSRLAFEANHPGWRDEACGVGGLQGQGSVSPLSKA